MAIVILILLLGASCFASAKPHAYQEHEAACIATMGPLKPCHSLYDPSEPTQACCDAAALLENEDNEIKLCECLKGVEDEAAVGVASRLSLQVCACGLSAKLPPVPVPLDMDCSQYVLNNRIPYRIMCKSPSMGRYWQRRFRVGSRIMDKNGDENNGTHTSAIRLP